MYKHKKAIALILVTAFIFTACAQAAAPVTPVAPAATPATPAPTPAPTPIPAAPAPTSWAEANIDNSMSYDEVVALAMQEGTVTWYSNSSRSRNVADSFMARYPGIHVEVFDISTNELIERFQREYDAGIRNADILHLADGDGTLWMEFVQRGMLHLYHPYDIVAHIDSAFLSTTMPMFIEYTSWFYNTGYFPDGPPVTSWWELTTPEWNARMLTRHPLDHIGTMALFATMLLYDDEMAADYERVFGNPISLSPGSTSATHEFIRRFMANDPIIIASSGEIVRSVGIATDNRVIGLGASGGLRRQEDEGLPIDILTCMTPSVGIPSISSLYITDEANNPNAAKLLVRFMTEAHGEGFAPFNTLGGWPPRADIPMHEGNPALSEINFWEQDLGFIYYNVLPIADFILSIQ